MRWILYVDMDAFYVSCELRDRPDLRGQPVAVGPNPREGRSRGVVLSASYEARKFGLRSAMPVSRAHALCPTAVWVPPDFSKYEAAAREVRRVLGQFSGDVVPFSIDEAAVIVDLPSPEAVGSMAAAIQERLSSELSLPASIGASVYRVVAKIATDRAKPGGICVVAPEATAEFLAPLGVGAIPGVGPKTQALLEGLGVQTIGDLRTVAPRPVLRRLGGFGEELRALAAGTPHETGELEVGSPKSRSADRTLAEDTRDVPTLDDIVRTLGREAAASVHADALRYETVTIRLRWEDFQQVQRGRSLGAAQEGSEPVLREGLRLLGELMREERAGRNRRVRLVSIRLGRLTPRTGRQRRLDRYIRLPPAGRSVQPPVPAEPP
ncbi:MAG: DNA polymerase IV [Thermoplasmata archaeon]|nr:DNA polymerase IV [Thermoplasmata archaeon]